MKVHRQERTSFIAVKERNSEQDAGLIMLSTRSRQTEIDANNQFVKPNGHIVSDKRPSLDHFMCNQCGDYVHRRGFSPDVRNKDGIRHICKMCDNEHRRRLYEVQRREVLKSRVNYIPLDRKNN